MQLRQWSLKGIPQISTNNQRILDQVNQQLVSPIDKKKQFMNSAEEEDLDFMNQLKDMGLETVIAQQRNQQYLSSEVKPEYQIMHNNQYLNLPYQNQFNNQNENFVDYSKINNNFQESREYFQPKNNKKLVDTIKIITKNIKLTKKQMNNLLITIQTFITDYKYSLMSLKTAIQTKTELVIQQISSQLYLVKRKNKSLQNVIEKYKDQITDQNNQIKQLQELLQQSKTCQTSGNQINYETLVTQISDLKNKINYLQKQNFELRNRLSQPHQKIQKVISYQSLKNSITSHQVDLKHKYLLMMQKFSEQISKLEMDITKLRRKQAQKNDYYLNWKNQLQKQENQVNRILLTLEERQKIVQQRQTQLIERQNIFIQNDSIKMKQANIKLNHIPMIYSQLNRNYTPQYEGTSTPQELIKQIKNKNKTIGSIKQRLPNRQIKSTVCLSRQQNYSSYPLKNQSLRQRTQYIQATKKKQKRYLNQNSYNKNISGRILNIQERMKRQLEEMGYNN